MAIYAIGDIQGCYDSLQRLLDKLEFSESDDQLWFVGDLVSRGKKSLKTLRFVKGLGDSAVTVLGNHDVSLISMSYGTINIHPSLKKLLRSKHSDELIEWLRFRPVLHVDKSIGFCMAHAGISPQWGLEEAQKYANEIEISLRGSDTAEWLKNVYGDKPKLWSNDLESYQRHRYILNAFMRMRYCNSKDGSLNFKLKGVPKIKKLSSSKQVPWFMYPQRKELPVRVVFGHWSSLGYYNNENVTAIDTGCVWGRQLTAVRLDVDIPYPISETCGNLK
jgi:bis(5'-nucleosyl)-tetraphosphatase (symmetrical)